jgi:3-oxoacyl-[acyl-carrier protein] reductase
MKYVIVTGGTKGLGFDVALKCLYFGYKVVVIGRSHTEQVKRTQTDFEDRLHFELFDFSNLSKIRVFSKKLTQKYGRPWGLINNAAIGLDGVLVTQHEKDISDLIRINIEAPILFTKYMIRPMILNRSGRVVNVSSIIASTGFNGLSVYGATKAALIGFTKSLSREVGKMGITVNAVAPGYMDTAMTKGIEDDKLSSIERRSAIKRLAKTSEVATAIEFLLKDESAAITGTTITVDGGSTA